MSEQLEGKVRYYAVADPSDNWFNGHNTKEAALEELRDKRANKLYRNDDPDDALLVAVLDV
jgi:hypothetical protein